MSKGLLFWVLMIIWFVFGLFVHFGSSYWWGPGSHTILTFVLFAILGWHCFGPAVK